MKNVILPAIMLALFTVSFQLFAKEIPADEARKAAAFVLKRSNRSGSYKLRPEPIAVAENGKTLFYVFRFQPTGFTIITADSRLPHTLFYTFNSDFEAGEQQDKFLTLLKHDVQLRLENLAKLPETMIAEREKEWAMILSGEKETETFQQWPPEGATPTGGWLMENWTQNAPYNNFCPVDPVTGNRSLAGCPATAMAMIVNYYATANDTEFSDEEDDYYHSYAGRNYWIDDDFQQHDFISFPEMNLYFDTLESYWQSGGSLKPNQKAALTFACGVAAQQVYTSSVSGTFGVDQAHDAYLRFGFDQCDLMYDTDTNLYSVLSSNMINAMPVHLAVVTPAWDMGHNVVMDGYNTNDYYHLNFGWGGSYNGWYLIPEEIPYGLTVIEGAVVDIFFIPTGLEEPQKSGANNILVFPNPASDFISFSREKKLSADAKIMIFDNSSRLVKEYKVNTKSNRYSIKNLETGIYFYIIREENDKHYGKFVVN